MRKTVGNFLSVYKTTKHPFNLFTFIIVNSAISSYKLAELLDTKKYSARSIRRIRQRYNLYNKVMKMNILSRFCNTCKIKLNLLKKEFLRKTYIKISNNKKIKIEHI